MSYKPARWHDPSPGKGNGRRIGISPQQFRLDLRDRLHHLFTGRKRILIGIELDDALANGRLLSRRVTGHCPDVGADELWSHGFDYTTQKELWELFLLANTKTRRMCIETFGIGHCDNRAGIG